MQGPLELASSGTERKYAGTHPLIVGIADPRSNEFRMGTKVLLDYRLSNGHRVLQIA